MKKNPIITIGLPVFNGENYLEEAIESLLEQTFRDCRIIISDNASTDRTQQICERYSAEYTNISYFRTEKNYGASWNFKRVFELSSSTYFKWMAHDDLLAADYLEKCIAALEENPEGVLAHPNAYVIDEGGQIIEESSHSIATDSPQAHLRYRDLLLDSGQCYEIFGVIRSEYLRQTEVMGNYGHADGVVLGHLSLMGPFVKVPELLFYSRRHGNQSIKVHMPTSNNPSDRPDYHAYTVWFSSSKKNHIIFPYWRILFENVNTIRRSRVQLTETIHCLFYNLKWIKRHRYFLIGDLKVAAKLERRTQQLYLPSVD